MPHKMEETQGQTVPHSVYKQIQDPQKLKTLSAFLEEELRFSRDSVPDSKDAIYANIRLSIHLLEKLMVKGAIPRNQARLLTLFSLTERLINDYPDYLKLNDAIVETIGIAQSVILFSKNGGVDCSKLESELALFIERNHLEHVIPRAISIHKAAEADRPVNVSSQYDAFIRKRHSVREYTPRIIDEKTLEEIVQTALLCPSECNMQPCKVYYSDDFEKIRKLMSDKMVMKDVYNLLVITVNKGFYAAGDLFQSWIDGGIFAESLIMAIHSRGLGACLFQCLKISPHYQKLKDSIGIPQNEDIVCCVGLGYLKDEYNIIETHRSTVSEMMVKF